MVGYSTGADLSHRQMAREEDSEEDGSEEEDEESDEEIKHDIASSSAVAEETKGNPQRGAQN